MRIVLDALGLPSYGGARSSAIGWIAALARCGQDNSYWVLVSRLEPELSGFPNLAQRIVPLHSRFLVRLWAQLAVPMFARSVEADLFHATKNLSTRGLHCPVVVTVNDLTHLLLPELYPLLDNLYWRHVQPLMLRSAARIVAISGNTRNDLQRCYGFSPDKMVVIYPSYSPRFQQIADEPTRAEVRARYGLPDRYVLYVGGLGLHKNVSTLVTSFQKIAGGIPHGLVLVGGTYHTSSDMQLYNGVVENGREQRIWLLDLVPDRDMPAIYQMADLFVLPSLSEGFGLTLLEAMVSGTAVVASAVGPIPEIVAGAAHLVHNPLDSNAFAEAMLEILSLPERREALRKAGKERAGVFSWDNTAEQTLSLYREVLIERQFPNLSRTERLA